MQPDRHGIREIGLADDDRGGFTANRVTKNDEACGRTGIEGHRGFARYRQRSDRFVRKLLHRIGFDRDDVCFARQGRRAVTSAASTAGRPCESFTSWIAAAAVRPAGLASGTRLHVASATRVRIEVPSSSAERRTRHRRPRIESECDGTARRDDEFRHGMARKAQ